MIVNLAGYIGKKLISKMLKCQDRDYTEESYQCMYQKSLFKFSFKTFKIRK